MFYILLENYLSEKSIKPLSIYFHTYGNLVTLNLSHNHLYDNNSTSNNIIINNIDNIQYNILSISTLTELYLKGNDLERIGVNDIFNSYINNSRLKILNMSCI